jgi:PilZ domain
MKIQPRKSKRLKVKTGIVNTPAGFCQIINLTPGGLSFKCVKSFSLSQEYSLDIYDTSGLNLELLQVKKIWEKIQSNQDAPTQFSMIVGVAFRHLSPSQKAQLDVYIRQLEGLQK